MQGYGCGITGYINQDSLKHAFDSTYCYLPFCILSVYIFSYFLFPFFLQKEKYAVFVIGFILIFALGVWINYFQSALFFKLASVKNITFEKKILLGYNNVCNAIIISGFVLGIKFAKNWYRQQNENFLLAKQKTIIELQLLKARIHPGFLFSSLNTLYKKISFGSPDSPLMILKLSEMMSYILYESDQKPVPLEQELTSISEFISISKLNMEDQSKLNLKISGNANDKFIVPLVLLNLLQNCLAIEWKDKREVQKTNVIIIIKDERLIFSLSFHYVSKTENNANDLQFLVQSERSRLDVLYQYKYNLDLLEQENSSELCLNIVLSSLEILTVTNTLKPIKKDVYESA